MQTSDDSSCTFDARRIRQNDMRVRPTSGAEIHRGFAPQPSLPASALHLRRHRCREAFSDLGDTDVPNGPFPHGDDGEIILILHGGDAAGGYTCHLFFRDGKLVRREIYGYLAKEPTEVKRFP